MPSPIPNYHHHHHSTADPQSHHHAPPPKPNTEILSLFLKAIIMALLTSLFFLCLGFAALVLLHLCLVGGLLHRLRSRHTTHLGTPSPSTGFSPRDVKKLPHFRISKGTEPGPETQCSVCLDGFRGGQCCRKLDGCGHIFHRRCVDAWLVKVAACPTCRTPVRLNAGALGLRGDVERDKANHFWTCGRTNALRSL